MEIKTMANPADNPLFKHFRQPAVYLKLPSQGQYYTTGSLDLPTTGQIPIYPMTVKDELTLRTPDALLNGSGMIEVIKSCCPNIKDPWVMPAVDVDPVFVAIRLASYGTEMDLDTTCPHCNAENNHALDLRTILDRYKEIDYSRPSFIETLKFKFKPQSYQDINTVSLINYEEQRLITSVVNNDELSEEEKTLKFAESFNKLKKMNIDIIATCIESITTEDEVEVSDRKFIYEFIENSSREVFNELKDKINKLVENNKTQPIPINCGECTKEYTTTLEFNQSNFFGNGS
jgi:hypothetical protein